MSTIDLTVNAEPVTVEVSVPPVHVVEVAAESVVVQITPVPALVVEVAGENVVVEISTVGHQGPPGEPGLPSLYERVEPFTNADAAILPRLAIRRNPETGRIYLVRNLP